MTRSVVILTANHSGPRHETEAEMVIVNVSDGAATLEQPDGETWEFDVRELLNALTAPLAQTGDLAA